MYETALILLGILLGLIPSWYVRKRRIKTHWSALRAELTQCKTKAEVFLKDEKLSPLYRFPNIAYRTSYPVLLTDGVVSEDEVLIIGRFFQQVEDINRGLDNAADAYKGHESIRQQQEDIRNRHKAKVLIRGESDTVSHYDQAERIVSAKINKRWWQYDKYV